MSSAVKARCVRSLVRRSELAQFAPDEIRLRLATANRLTFRHHGDPQAPVVEVDWEPWHGPHAYGVTVNDVPAESSTFRLEGDDYEALADVLADRLVARAEELEAYAERLRAVAAATRIPRRKPAAERAPTRPRPPALPPAGVSLRP